MKFFLNRRVLSLLLYYSGILHLVLIAGKWFGYRSPLFLAGHRVLPQDTSRRDGVDAMALLSGHAISDKEFERRLRFIMRYRRAGDPAELTRGSPPSNSFYLTMDDGYLDNHEIAGPVLEKLNVKAVIFCVGELLRCPSTLPWWDLWGAQRNADEPDREAVTHYARRCEEMKRGFPGLLRHKDPQARAQAAEDERLYISEREARELHGAGTFYLASHTQSHANLRVLSEAEIAREIDDGIAALRAMPGYLPLFAYPFGLYDERALAHLDSRKDIVMAFATGRGDSSNRLTVRRINFNTTPFTLFAAECSGVFDFLSRLRSRATRPT